MSQLQLGELAIDRIWINPKSRDDPATEALLAEARGGFNPDRIVALVTPENLNHETSLPLFHGRRMIDGLPTAYVCRNYACELPVNNVKALQTQLNQNN